jgi:hypothetical protein
MKKSFEKLRLTAGASVLGLLAGVCGVSRSARAAVVATPAAITTGGGHWFNFRNSNTGPGTFGNGFAMTSGALVGPPTRGDSFDGAMMCRVNGTTFVNPGGNVDLSSVAGGKKVTSNAATIGGLSVRMSFYASNGQPVLRGICAVTNTTGAPIVVTVLMGSNLGSDNQTIIRNSSSGNTAVDSADRWFVSSDANPATGDPVLLIGRFGAGAATLPTLVQTPGVPPSPGANDNFVDQFTFSVAPGQTSSVMQLAWLNTDVAPANANAPKFNSTATLQAAGLLGDLTPAEIAGIVNYGPATGSGAATAAIPALSETGTLVLAVLVGASALVHFARRRRAGEL